MRVSERIVGDVVILGIRGDLTIDRTGDVLTDKVRTLVRQGHRKLLIDLDGVSLDSAGLGQIVQSYVTMKNNGGTVKLLRPTPYALELLTVTKLSTVLQSYALEGDGIASFSAPAA